MGSLKRIFRRGVVLCALASVQTMAAETYQVNIGISASTYDSVNPAISGDGRFVAFEALEEFFSFSDETVEFTQSVFVYDRTDGRVARVPPRRPNGPSFNPAISGDGLIVAFTSSASDLDLDPSDGNGKLDIFVHDRTDGSIERVSVGPNGSNGASFAPAISADGRFVAFASSAFNLVNDLNMKQDIFVHDRTDGSIERVSVGPNESNGDSNHPAISGDGRFVAFSSKASNLDLVRHDGNGLQDIFVHDRKDGSTKRVSVGPNGSNGTSSEPSISGDGRFVAFASFANNLVSIDNNLVQDIFVHDRIDGSIERVSVGQDESNGPSFEPVISGDGRFVAFASDASNLVSNDQNGRRDIFVHDRSDGSIQRVSVGPNGSDGSSFLPAISGDGRFIAFDSGADNLVPDRNTFVRDQGTVCDVDDEVNQVTLVNNEWHQLALPCLPPAGASVGELFGANFQSHYSVFFYDGQNYLRAEANTPMAHGQGMWVLQTTGADVTVKLPVGSRTQSSNFNSSACAPGNIGCFSMPLAIANWQMIGSPFSFSGGIPLEDLLVTTTDGSCVDGCAIAESPVGETLFHYQSGQYNEVSGDGELEIWAGYWVSMAVTPDPGDPALLFPELRMPELVVLNGAEVVDSGGSVFIDRSIGEAVSFTVQNIGDAAAANISFNNVGADNQLVNTSGFLCGSPTGFLAPGASCEVTVSIPDGFGTFEQRSINISYRNSYQDASLETGQFSVILNNCPPGVVDPFCP